MTRAMCGSNWKSAILLGMMAATAPGCAALAVKPDTPADDMTLEELERDPPPANERFYMLIFGSESEPKRAKYTHSWATFVRVVDPGNGQPPCIEPNTISWMPATLDIHPLRIRVEPGTNLDLATTIRVMLSNDERISLWGPYEIRRGLYRKALIQKEFMESGRVGYQCIDTIGESARQGNGSDCIHAMTDMDSKFDRGNYPLSKFGDKASEHVVKQVIDRHAVIDPCTTHDWLLGPLGIANCPIVRREDDGRRTRREIMSANRANADQAGR